MEYRKVGEITTYDTRSESHETVDKKKRYKQIINVLKENPNGLTAKEIACVMYSNKEIPSNERNYTAPRLTELSYKGVVEPIGKKKCTYTGKTVAVYKLIERQTSIYDFVI